MEKTIEVLRKITVRIYDEEILDKYQELKQRAEKESDHRQYGDNYVLYYIINLAHQKMKERDRIDEQARGAIQETREIHQKALDFETKRSLRQKKEGQE